MSFLRDKIQLKIKGSSKIIKQPDNYFIENEMLINKSKSLSSNESKPNDPENTKSSNNSKTVHSIMSNLDTDSNSKYVCLMEENPFYIHKVKTKLNLINQINS